MIGKYDYWVNDPLPEEKPGLFPIKQWFTYCTHPEHNVPVGVYIPHGYGYKHICPACGYVSVVFPPQTWC